MKLLFDENLSPRLAESLRDLYPGSDQVHNLNLGGAKDSDVWDFAKLHGFARFRCAKCVGERPAEDYLDSSR